MPFKLAIADVVNVPLKFQLQDGGTTRQFNYSLQCKRVSMTEWNESVMGDNGLGDTNKIRSTMMNLTIGWKGQTLVSDEDGQPADFCEEALEIMFGASGVLDLATAKYMAECAAKVKN